MKIVNALANEKLYLIYYGLDGSARELVTLGIGLYTVRAGVWTTILCEDVSKTTSPVVLSVIHLEGITGSADIRAAMIDLPCPALLVTRDFEYSAIPCFALPWSSFDAPISIIDD